MTIHRALGDTVRPESRLLYCLLDAEGLCFYDVNFIFDQTCMYFDCAMIVIRARIHPCPNHVVRIRLSPDFRYVLSFVAGRARLVIAPESPDLSLI